MKTLEKGPQQEKLFKRIVAVSSGLGFAFMLATLASLRPGKTSGIQFTWHWTVVLWAFAAFACNWRFWTILWQVQDNPTPKLTSQFKLNCALLVALGLGAFLYPIRFVAAGYGSDISKGLVTAVLFLGTLGWIIRKIGRAFVEADALEAKKY